jgi:hypothetical protein
LWLGPPHSPTPRAAGAAQQMRRAAGEGIMLVLAPSQVVDPQSWPHGAACSPHATAKHHPQIPTAACTCTPASSVRPRSTRHLRVAFAPFHAAFRRCGRPDPAVAERNRGFHGRVHGIRRHRAAPLCEPERAAVVAKRFGKPPSCCVAHLRASCACTAWVSEDTGGARQRAGVEEFRANVTELPADGHEVYNDGAMK